MITGPKKTIVLLLWLSTLIAAAPPPPPELAPYIKDDHFKPGDYRWLRGGFSGASTTEIAAYQAILEWRRRCRVSDMAETRAEVTALGVQAGESLNTIPYRSLVCAQVSTLPEPINLGDWNGFARDVAVVRPLMQSYIAAVVAGEGSALDTTSDLRDSLNGRVAGEQMLRTGIDWAEGSSPDGLSPESLTPQQRGILSAELAIEMQARDHANTAWLKQIVEMNGWPKRSQVGDNGVKRAWLLVQHADANPAFQVTALRLIEPLLATDEANRKDYAYLYDRVMLKIVGKQRYGTQLICRGGRFEPMPLEDDKKVDDSRRKVGFDSLANAITKSNAKSGLCENS